MEEKSTEHEGCRGEGALEEGRGDDLPGRAGKCLDRSEGGQEGRWIESELNLNETQQEDWRAKKKMRNNGRAKREGGCARWWLG